MTPKKDRYLPYFKAIFQLARIYVNEWIAIPNEYWPDDPKYDDVRAHWYLAVTDVGMVKIGWRKRVINIDWSRTPIFVNVTEDLVTKNQTMVHAWSYAKAVEYMTVWSMSMNTHLATRTPIDEEVRDGG